MTCVVAMTLITCHNVYVRRLVQTTFGKISVIVTLGGGGGGEVVTLRKNLLSTSIVL